MLSMRDPAPLSGRLRGRQVGGAWGVGSRGWAPGEGLRVGGGDAGGLEARRVLGVEGGVGGVFPGRVLDRARLAAVEAGLGLVDDRGVALEDREPGAVADSDPRGGDG